MNMIKAKEYTGTNILKMPLGLMQIFIIISLVLCVSGINDYSVLGIYTASDGKKCYHCTEGMYWKGDCIHNMTTSICKPCPYQTFNNRSGKPLFCQPCQKFCPQENSHIKENCTPTRDIICECNGGFYQYHKLKGEKNEWMCKLHSYCPASFGVEVIGTPVKDTVCEKCQHGTYSNSTSSTDKCLSCTKCKPPQFEEESCNGVKDTVCSPKEISYKKSSIQDELLHLLPHLLAIVVPIFAIVLIIIIVVIICAKRKRKWCFREPDEQEKSKSFVEGDVCLTVTGSENMEKSLNNLSDHSHVNQAAEEVDDARLETDGPGNLSDTRQTNQREMNLDTCHTVARTEAPTWDRLFMELSGKIAANWEFIILDLFGKGGNYKIEEAKANYPTDVQRQIFSCLNKWREKQGEPNINEVIAVLQKQSKLSKDELRELEIKYRSL